MSYGGIDIVEFDPEHGRFYIHREDGDYWNTYKISDEPGFVDWIESYKDELEIYDLSR